METQVDWVPLLAAYLEETKDVESVMLTLRKRWPNSTASYISSVRREWMNGFPKSIHKDFAKAFADAKIGIDDPAVLSKCAEFESADIARKLRIQKKMRGSAGFTGDGALDSKLAKIPALPNYVSALRLDDAEMLAERTKTKKALDKRNSNVRTVSFNLLDAALELLKSDDAIDLAVGLAAVTGRRMIEIFKLGSFASKKSLGKRGAVFSGQAKKGCGESVVYDIPLLADVETVKAALKRLRAAKPCVDLDNRQVNLKFSNACCASAKRFFGDKSARFHDLRGLYAVLSFNAALPHKWSLSKFASSVLGHAGMQESLHYTTWRLEGDVPEKHKIKWKQAM